MFLYSLIWNVFRTKITEHCTIFSSLNNASKFIWLITNENWSAIKQLGLFNTTCLETRKLSPKRHTCQCTQFRQATPGNSKKWASYRMYRKRPPRIVNRTVPKIIVISVHTVNRFPLRVKGGIPGCCLPKLGALAGMSFWT
jgi:hypothetical protein